MNVALLIIINMGFTQLPKSGKSAAKLGLNLASFEKGWQESQNNHGETLDPFFRVA